MKSWILNTTLSLKIYALKFNCLSNAMFQIQCFNAKIRMSGNNNSQNCASHLGPICQLCYKLQLQDMFIFSY